MITSTLWDLAGAKIGIVYLELEDAIEIAKHSEFRFVVACDAYNRWFLPTNTPELYGAIRWVNEELHGK